ncbi:four helix bundle protein [Verrucomicrobiales bacterium BCK34]|nr:four helix bundle protein [Verrucomicrobiales bacterium BCK34]
MSQSNFAERFEDLRVWQDARTQAGELYREFGDQTAAARDFGFRDQIQRASVSVMNNISEGFERGYQTEFARFLKIAKASCGEVRSMLYLAEDLGYLNSEKAELHRNNSEKLSRSLSALESSIRKNLN